MLAALKRIFGVREAYPTGWDEHPTLQRQQAKDAEFPASRFSSMRLRSYRYWCPCGTELTDGPCGGAAVNAVCETCKINYGDLPGYWGR